MDWNSSILRNSSFVSHPSEFSSSNLLYNFNQFGRFTGLEAKHHDGDAAETLMASNIVPASMEMMGDQMIQMMSYGNQEKMMKKRLTANQLESLESSFQEEKKLEPDRKMRLARDLGLQPRQVAVWFQNRRARWKNKKLEHLYDALKHDFDVVSKEKQKLQKEVQRLKCMLMEQQGSIRSRKKQVCSGYTEGSCEETTLESTSTTTSSADRNCNINNSTPSQPFFSRELNKVGVGVGGHYHHLFINNNNLDVFNNNNNNNNNVVSSPSYWAALASL